MSSKVKYVCAVLSILLITLMLNHSVKPKVIRKEQHKTYNTQVEDVNRSINAEQFSTKLPIVTISTGNQTIPGKATPDMKVANIIDESIEASMQIVDEEGTLHSLSDPINLQSKIQIRVRGNSSRHFDKSSYLIKCVDEMGIEKNLDVMDMGKGDTWVLHGPYLDKTLMRNYMWYNLAAQTGEWAPEVRFCEVFINDEYQGVYVMMEQISVGKDRLNLSKYDERSTVTSYILCLDRINVNDNSYLNNFTQYANRIHSTIEIKYPGKTRITPELIQSISKDFSRFEKSLYSYDYNSKVYGYEKYIDVSSFVHYFIINEVSQNADAGVFSTYLYKDVAGKLKLSVWDFNNSVNNYIETEHNIEGFFMQNRPWFSMLMKDDAFVTKIIHRYKELRKNILSDEYITNYIHDVDQYLGVAVERNFEVWKDSLLPENELLEGEGRGIETHQEAMKQYEGRLLERLAWMDENIETLYSYSHESVNKKFND